MTLIGLEPIVLTDCQSETVEGGHQGAQDRCEGDKRALLVKPLRGTLT